MSGTPERPDFELPDTTDIDSVNAAQVAVIRQAAHGLIGARDALCFSRMLEHRRRAIGTATLWQKMKELEARRQREREGQP